MKVAKCGHKTKCLYSSPYKNSKGTYDTLCFDCSNKLWNSFEKETVNG